MKVPLPSLILIALVGSLAGCQSTESASSVSVDRDLVLDFPIEEPPGGFTLGVRNGDTREAVGLKLGRPDWAIGPSLWVYQRNVRAALGGKLDTLVIAFERDRVSAMRLLDGEILRAALAEMPRGEFGALVGPR